MNNRMGKEWQFNVTTDRKLIPDHNTIQNSIPPLVSELVYISPDLKRSYDCMVTVHEILTINCMMVFDNISDTKAIYLKNITEPLFFGPNFFQDLSDKIPIITVIEKKNRSRRTLLKYEKMRFTSERCPIILPSIHSCGKWFTDQLSEQLFRALDSSLKLYTKDRNEDILWFNIDNRPKYCFQSGTVDLSIGARHRNKRN